MRRRGIFITLDGMDGSGKSTQARLLGEFLRARGYRVVTTREPGGTPLGEAIRRVLLGRGAPRASALAELALMYAARAQHIEEVVRPALERGQAVVSDRYHDASMAYQGYGRGLGAATVRAFDRIVCRDWQPDLTLILDLEPEESLRRVRGRKQRRSRFEAAGLPFLKRVRAGYRAIARREPKRVILVRAGRSVAEVQRDIRAHVERSLREGRRRRAPRRRKPVPSATVTLPMGAF